MQYYQVVFTPESEEQLLELYRYIAAAASPETAFDYIEAIIAYCESLRIFPLRGTKRDDLRLGLRITHYRKRVSIAFDVTADVVSIIGIFYGGQNYESLLRDDLEKN